MIIGILLIQNVRNCALHGTALYPRRNESSEYQWHYIFHLTNSLHFQCSLEGQFNRRIIWLFLTSESLSSHLFCNLTYLNIRIDSNVFIAVYDMEANIQVWTISSVRKLQRCVTKFNSWSQRIWFWKTEGLEMLSEGCGVRCCKYCHKCSNPQMQEIS